MTGQKQKAKEARRLIARGMRDNITDSKPES